MARPSVNSQCSEARLSAAVGLLSSALDLLEAIGAQSRSIIRREPSMRRFINPAEEQREACATEIDAASHYIRLELAEIARQRSIQNGAE